MENKKTFLKGAVIMGLAGVLIKFLGAFFRIPLGNIIGDNGLAYYQGAYPVYVFLLTLSTAGIPTAISKLISERQAVDEYEEAHRVFKISFVLMFAIGLATAAILFFGADYICGVMKNPGAYYSMRAIAPALFFVPMMAAMRGYFQGMQDMAPTATSQVVEQFFRVGFGLALAIILMSSSGLEYAAAGASSGAAFGGLFGTIAIFCIYVRRKKDILKKVKSGVVRAKESSGAIVKKILAIAIPVTIGASIMPIMNLIDSALVMRRLQTAAGFTESAAESLYGQLSGMVASIINFPQVISMGIAVSLVPVISAAFKKRDMDFVHKNVELGMRTALLVGLPCSFGIVVLAEPIMLLLYPLQKASAVSSASCLFIMGIGVMFLSSVQTLTGILQGIGKPLIPVRNMIVGAVVKIACTYFLVGIASINVKGAAFGTVCAYAIAAILDFIAVKRYTGTKFNPSMTFVKPLVSSVIMAAAVYIAYKVSAMVFGNSISTIISVLVGIAVYGFIIIAIKGITAEEIRTLPKGRKLAKIVSKIQR